MRTSLSYIEIAEVLDRMMLTQGGGLKESWGLF